GSSLSASASTVSTRAPARSIASRRHDGEARSFTRMLQAPHIPIPSQALRTLVRPYACRSRSNAVVVSATVTCASAPLSTKLTLLVACSPLAAITPPCSAVQRPRERRRSHGAPARRRPDACRRRRTAGRAGIRPCARPHARSRRPIHHCDAATSTIEPPPRQPRLDLVHPLRPRRDRAYEDARGRHLSAFGQRNLRGGAGERPREALPRRQPEVPHSGAPAR